MSLVTVLYGPAYDGKNDETFEKCLEKIRAREAQSCVYLVRSDVRVRRLRERILRDFSGCFYFPVTTLPDFLKALYCKMPAHKTLLGELEQKILLEHILHEQSAKRGGDSYLDRYREHPGIVAKLQDFLAAVRRIGFASAEELASSLRACRGRRPRVYEELLELFERYTQALDRSGKIDETGIFLELARLAERGKLMIDLWTQSPELLVLEGYYELTRPVQQIFSALCAQFEQTFITLDLPDNPYEYTEDREIPKAFRVYRHILPYIRESGFSVRQYKLSFSLRPEAEAPKTSEGILQRDPEQVSVRAYADRKEEVIRIAREIRHLRQNGNVEALHDIGVAFPLLEQYEHLIQEIFPRYGIPFSMFQGYSLASSPVVISIFRLFQVILEDCDLNSLQTLFSSPLIQWVAPLEAAPTSSSSQEGNHALALDAESLQHFETLARRLEIRKGREEWLEKLAVVKLPSQEGNPRPRSGSKDKKRTLEREEKPLEDALIPSLEDFLRFLGRFEAQKRYQGEDFLDFIREAIRRFQLPQRILQTESRRIREKESSALTKFLKLLDTFEQELRQHSSEHGRYSSFSPREFSDMLRTLVIGERYYAPQHLDDSVFILGRLDTRQLRFRYFFFGGLIERDFPGQDDQYIFLSEQDADGLGLPGYHDKLEESAHLFYLNSLNPSERLYLSYPLQEEEKDLLRSSYIEQLARQFKDKEQTFASVDGESANSPQALYTLTELYEWLGRYWREKQPQEDANTEIEGLLKHVLRTKNSVRIKSFVEALQTQNSRNSAQLSAFDGMLAAHWSKARLQRRYDPQKHIYSVSEFDLYARCPIKFFFQRLLGLAPLAEVLPDMDALEKGTLLHRILFRFYAAEPETLANTREQGNVDRRFLQGQSYRESWQREARIRMRNIAEEELAAYRFSGVFWERYRESLLSGLSPETSQKDDMAPEPLGLLAAFVASEIKSEDKVRPRYLEAHFGMTNVSRFDGTAGEFGYQLSAAPCELRGNTRDLRPAAIRFQGKIDRIDLEDPNALGTVPKAVLYDYKTGHVPTNGELKNGRSFQLPLYLLALRRFLGEDAEAIAGGYYALRSADELAKKVSLGSKEHNSQKYFNTSQSRPSVLGSYHDVLSLLEHYADLAVQSAEEMRDGRFHPTFLKEHEAGCAYCDYRQICRLDPQRMKQIPKI